MSFQDLQAIATKHRAGVGRPHRPARRFEAALAAIALAPRLGTYQPARGLPFLLRQFGNVTRRARGPKKRSAARAAVVRGRVDPIAAEVGVDVSVLKVIDAPLGHGLLRGLGV